MRSTELNGVQIQSRQIDGLLATVHARPDQAAPLPGVRYGMISLRESRPPINRLLYRYLCLTGHFGCGHVELAFYEKGSQVTIYGIRNIARANALRLGLAGAADQLSIADGDESQAVLLAVLKALNKLGLNGRLAPPHRCVDLAVNKRLLKPAACKPVLRTLHRRYAHLYSATAKQHVDAVGAQRLK